MTIPEEWGSVLRLGAVTAIALLALWFLGWIFTHHFLRFKDLARAAKLEFRTLMGWFSFLGFLALLLSFNERSFFEEIKTLLFPYDFNKGGPQAADHEDYVLIVGMVMSFLGNLIFIAIMSQKGRHR